MSLLWKEAFTLGDFSWSNTNSFSDIIEITDLEALKHFLDAVHVKFCLLKPWCETENYPLVDSRDLLPSFEAELWEYKGLPGFSMVAFARPLESFSEIFQYDILHPVLSAVNTAEQMAQPLTVKAMHNPMKKPARSTNQRLMSVGMASHRMVISPRPSMTAAT